MSGARAEVHITKIAAAQRQIDAAIRMLFAGEDELAVHTVAAAAYRIVRDLRRKRGISEIPREASIEGLFFTAKAYAENRSYTLPQALRNVTDVDPQVQRFASFLREQAAKNRRNLELDDFSLSTFGIDERAYWAKLGEAANFLKHADQDHRASISLSKFNSEELLAGASSSYFNLTNKATPEIGVFMLYQSAKSFDDSKHLEGLDATFVDALRRVGPELRGQACLQFISILKQERPE